jgi:hypothetical protein
MVPFLTCVKTALLRLLLLLQQQRPAVVYSKLTSTTARVGQDAVSKIF